MKRKSYYLPALLLVLLVAGGVFPRPAGADELVIGRITALDREAGTMLMEVKDEAGQTAEMHVVVDQRQLPATVGEGSVVRAWLSPLEASEDVRTARGTSFTAGRIWPAGGGGNDRTGIRSRLKRAAGGGGRGTGGGSGGNRGR